MNHLNRILARLEKVSPQGQGHIACCPAHDDANPSMSVDLGRDGYVRLKCRSASCTQASILAALELSPSDLLPDRDDDLILPDPAMSDLIVEDQFIDEAPVITNAATRGKVYRRLLELLNLSDFHRQGLRDRGLSDPEIDRLGYRTNNIQQQRNAISLLCQEFTEDELLAVPGFKKDRPEPMSLIESQTSLFVPVRNLGDQIVGIVSRREPRNESDSKYVWLSGWRGISCGAPMHVPLNTPAQCAEVRLTEGQLKADIAFVRSGLPTIGVPGVGNWKSALPVLQQLGAQTIRLAFDMDLLVKPHVAVAALRCAQGLIANGLEVYVERWFLPDGKGIDDLLAAGKVPQLLQPEGALTFLRKHAGVNDHTTISRVVCESRPKAGRCQKEESPSTAPKTRDEVAPKVDTQPKSDALPTDNATEATMKAEGEAQSQARTSPHPQEISPQANHEASAETAITSEEIRIQPQVMSFPLEVFPVQLQRFAQVGADSLNCPVDFLAAPMLAIAATAIGASRALESKPGWRESTRMYLAVVAPPGSGKSPAESLVCRPLFALQDQYRSEYQRAKAAYDVEVAERKTRTRDRSASRPAEESSLDGSPSTDSVTEQQTAQQPEPAASSAAQRIGVPPEKPDMRRILVVDTTTEALAPILAKNPRGIIVIKDELTAWVRSMDQYRGGRGTDRQFYLSCWGGQPAIVDRKSQEEPIIISRPFLNVIGGIQPDMLATLRDDQGRSDGFVDRILFSFPDDIVRGGWNEQGVDPDLERAWAQAIRLLFQLTMHRCVEDDVDLPQLVRFTPVGKANFVNWFDAHAREMAAPDLNDQLKGHWSKINAYAHRLILVVHLLRLVGNEVHSEDVDEESVRRGILLVDYFKSHCRKVHSQLPRDGVDRQVDQIVSWISDRGGECTARALQRNEVAGVKKTSQAKKLMQELADRGFGELVDRTAENGKTVTWFVLSMLRRPASNGEPSLTVDASPAKTTAC